jgi:hypothetical protein
MNYSLYLQNKVCFKKTYRTVHTIIDKHNKRETSHIIHKT